MSIHRTTARRSKQQRLAEAILGMGVLAPLRRLHDRGRHPVLILAYHRIADAGDPATYPLDLDIISATPGEFEAQLRMLSEHANPVSLEQVADAVAGNGPLPERAVAVTFDDGFSDTFEVAFPLLQRFRVPATVFVSTGHIESADPYWFEFAAHLMLRIPPRSIVLEECPAGLPHAADVGARRDSIERLHRALKACDAARRRELVGQWRHRFAADLDERALARGRSITRQQIEQMARAGISFGSHTISHPNLSLATDAAIELELRDSKRALEAILGRRVRTLAYPFGMPGTYDSRAIRIARECGYELAVSFRQGVNWLGGLQPLELRRVGIAAGTPDSQFRVMTALPNWLHPNFDGHH